MLDTILNKFKQSRLNAIFKQKRKAKSKEELEAAAVVKRQQIIDDAQAMKRLLEDPNFKRFCQLLIDDMARLNKGLLNMELTGSQETSESINMRRTESIARINQIERILSKPNSLIWDAKNLTEVRGVLKEQQKQSHREAGSR